MFSKNGIKKYAKNVVVAIMAVLIMLGGMSPVVANAATTTQMVTVKAYKTNGSGSLSMADKYLNDQAMVQIENGTKNMTLTFSKYTDKMENIKVSIDGMKDQYCTVKENGFSFDVPDKQTDIKVSLEVKIWFMKAPVSFIVKQV